MYMGDTTPAVIEPVAVAQDAGKGLLVIAAIALFLMWASGKH
jgi:hypothetical protein